ncbi:hypothetical protein [Glutamicibacter sp. NPDC090743]|uniref:hypothetical protein n=1 Tax=Glutamicibacter sp. NPDC090743 TaxID=3364001 RepID=UPI0038259288
MIFGISLSAVLAIVFLVIFREDRSSYVLVLFTSFVGFILLRAQEQNSRVLRKYTKHLRAQSNRASLRDSRLDQLDHSLSALRKDHHSNELRLRRLLDWSRNRTASFDETKDLMRTCTAMVRSSDDALKDMKPIFDSLKSDRLELVKRQQDLSESVRSIAEDATKILSDGHSNELRLRRLVESIAALTEEAKRSEASQHSNELRLRRLVEFTTALSEEVKRSEASQHSNELRLRRLVEMNLRVEEKLIDFAEATNSQSAVQYKSQALARFRMLEDLHEIKDAVKYGLER